MKIGVTGCSHSSKNYGGKPWWYWMGEEYKVEVVPTSSRGGANEINIEKLKYIFDNYTDISHVVIQLTHPARITMGVSVLKEEEEIGPHSPTMINGAQVINFTTVRNDNYIKSMFYEDYTPSLDFIYNQSVASRYNLEFKLIHTMMSMAYLCEKNGAKPIFFSWYVDLEKLTKKIKYLDLLKNMCIINGTVDDFTKKNKVPSLPQDSHFGNESQKIIFEQFINPQLKTFLS